ncbi:hypothetical protein L6R49_09350 [Myxococcota bacterium]|nr:hypothetical protein [Myxococcota bacterium]
MKGLLAAVAALLLGLSAWTERQEPGALAPIVKDAAARTLWLAPAIGGMLLLVALVERALPTETLRAWLNGPDSLRGLGLAWLAGVVTPGGPIVGLPLAAALGAAGVGPGVLVTYLTSLSLLNLTRLPFEAGVLGARLTLTRLLACLLLPILAGLLARGRISA